MLANGIAPMMFACCCIAKVRLAMTSFLPIGLREARRDVPDERHHDAEKHHGDDDFDERETARRAAREMGM